MVKTYRFLIPVLLIVVSAASFLYLEFPLAVLRPVFYQDKINLYSREYGIDPLFIISIIKVESNFSKSAKSRNGAVGLMQLMPSTAEELAGELGYKNFAPEYLTNPDVNIRLGVYYISKLQKEFNNNEILTLAAYNAGMRKAGDWHKENPLLEVDINDIPYAETREYVKSVRNNYAWLKWIQNLRNLVRGKNP
jgi:soluble lytic murein transglycosylase